MTATVPPDVLGLFRRQAGICRRQDLVRAGLSRRAFNRLISTSALRPLGRGVVSAQAEASDDEALLAAMVGLAGVVSGASAARCWGIELVTQPTSQHVTVARNRSGASWRGTVVHRSNLPDCDRTTRQGLAVTSALRTVLDLCRQLPLAEAVVAADSALRKGLITFAQLRRAAVELPAGRGRPRVVRVVTLVDSESGSVLESLCRVLLRLAGLLPETQYVVHAADGRIVGRLDFAWPMQLLVVEADGYAFHSDRDSYRTDRRRANELVLLGWRILRFSWEDVVERPEVVVAQVRAALEA